MKTLRIGDRGVWVKVLQSTLKRLGFSAGRADGIFGKRTENAVKAFQSSAGLSADGIVGQKTWEALMPYLEGVTEHRIVAGDTLWKLANKYSSTVNALKAANPGVDELNLQIGETLTIPIGSNVVMTDVDYFPELMYMNIESLKTRYPFIETGSIGRSVDGRDIPYLRIGGTSCKRKVCYNASHHANEWITSLTVMKFAEDYCRAYINGGVIGGVSTEELFNGVAVYIVPMVNPDGVALVTGAEPQGSTSYKAASAIAAQFPSIPFPDGWKANIRGTDLNLNYPAGWEEAKRIKYEQGFTKPAPRDYVGRNPLSEPETQALATFTDNQRFSLTLSYHTQGEVIYWKYLSYEVPGAYAIGGRLADASGYSLETVPTESGYAGYKDWVILKYRVPSYTVEAGIGQNPLPLSQFGEIYEDNVGLMAVAAEAMT